MESKTPQTTQTQYDILNLLQFIFEIAVIVGYVIAIIPGLYFITFLWVIPLTIANLVFSIMKENDTLPYTGTNVAMSLITFLPLIGWLSIIVGIVMSILSALKVSKLMNLGTASSSNQKGANGHTVEAITTKAKTVKEVDIDEEKAVKEDKSSTVKKSNNKQD
jgi:hypothetical protein